MTDDLSLGKPACRRAIETSPRNPYSYQALAAMEWQSGNRDEARRVLAEGPRCDFTSACVCRCNASHMHS